MTLTHDNIKKQLNIIFDSSTISTNSESIDVKSEPVFYLNKGTEDRYQDSKDSSRDGTSQHPKGGYRSSRTSIQGVAIDIIETCHTEIATIKRKKILTNVGKKQTH